MASEGRGRGGEATWLLVLAGLALVSTLWSAVSYGRLRRTWVRVERREAEVPRLRRQAERLLALRAQLGQTGRPGPGASGPELIPLLESTAIRTGISREVLSIRPEDPKPLPTRPDLLEQATYVELKRVQVRALVQFLVSAERALPALEVRELTLTPLPEDRQWSARVLLVVTIRKTSPTP